MSAWNIVLLFALALALGANILLSHEISALYTNLGEPERALRK